MGFLDALLRKKKGPSAQVENLALLQAMTDVAGSDNAETRRKLYAAMLDAVLLVPVPEVPRELAPGTHTTSSPVAIQISGIVDAKGVRITPVFTDVEALRNWDPNTPYIGLTSVDLFRVLLQKDAQDVLINPFDPIRKMIRPGGRVTRCEIEQLATGVAPTNTGHQQFTFKKDEKVLIGLPVNPPTAALQETLRDRAQQIPQIAELYFFQMARGQRESTTVIGVYLGQSVGEADRRQIMQELGLVIQGKMQPGQFLDFMFPEGSFGEHIRKVGGTIFRR